MRLKGKAQHLGGDPQGIGAPDYCLFCLSICSVTYRRIAEGLLLNSSLVKRTLAVRIVARGASIQRCYTLIQSLRSHSIPGEHQWAFILKYNGL